MALIVEDGTGKTNADSFVETADVDAYVLKFGLAFAGTTTEKEVACRQATRYLESVYSLRILGSRVSIDQSLSWPRVGVIDRDGFAFGSDLVPQEWKDATCEMAVVARVETILPDLATPGDLNEKSVTVGPISVSKRWDSGQGQLKYYRRVDLLVKRFVIASSAVVRS